MYEYFYLPEHESPPGPPWIGGGGGDGVGEDSIGSRPGDSSLAGDSSLGGDSTGSRPGDSRIGDVLFPLVSFMKMGGGGDAKKGGEAFSGPGGGNKVVSLADRVSFNGGVVSLYAGGVKLSVEFVPFVAGTSSPTGGGYSISVVSGAGAIVSFTATVELDVTVSLAAASSFPISRSDTGSFPNTREFDPNKEFPET